MELSLGLALSTLGQYPAIDSNPEMVENVPNQAPVVEQIDEPIEWSKILFAVWISGVVALQFL